MINSESRLKDVFPYVVELDRDWAGVLINALVESKENASNGTSFAVTADSLDSNKRRVWLSENSMKYASDRFL